MPLILPLGPATLGRLLAAGAALALAACATRSDDVRPATSSAAEFAAWSCERIDDETSAVQRRAADTAYAVDERAGRNIVALGLGLAVFWPALFALTPDGPETTELAQLKGRFEALREASRLKACPPAGDDLPAARAAALPVAIGDRLVYETRSGPRRPAAEAVWTVRSLRRDGIELAGASGVLVQDAAGNVSQAPPGALQWPRLLRGDLQLGAVMGGDLMVSGDPLTRARVRGQVVAVGPQAVAGREFDAAVIDLFGDAQHGDASTRLVGALVVDRTSGVLLRLDLRSADPAFSMRRRLTRIEAAR